MSKLYKIDKDLSIVSSKSMASTNVNALTILHTWDGVVSNSTTLNFTIDITSGHVPYINEEEFMIVIRERVDATARGTQDITITNVGEDIGKENYNEKVPYRPWELPQGFTELKGQNE